MRLSGLQWDHPHLQARARRDVSVFDRALWQSSSSHHYGVEPKRAVSALNHARLSFTLVLCTDKLKLDQARLSILRLVQCPHGDGAIDKDALMMTGCGTESNNWAIRSALLSARDRADGGLLHVVTSE